MKGKIYSGVTSDYSTRIYVAITTDMVEDARVRHNATPLATAGLGRVMTAASVMGKMMKNETDKLTLSFKGNGIVENILATSWSNGNVKAYTSNPDAVLPSRADGKIDVGGSLGEGSVTVVRDLGLKEPFIGQAELVTGEIAEDLAMYYMTSEQQPSVISLGVSFDKESGKVSAAGGIFIQPLPNASDEVLDKIETSIRVLLPVSQLIEEGMTGPEIMEMALNQFETQVTEENEIEYKCDCSRERIEGALISVGKEELKAIIEEDGKAELHCHFCNTYYNFTKEELETLYSKL